MFFTLSLFWFIRETKAILFYLYLWQLKEYHIGRFLDHFRTEKGKRLLVNKLLILKIIFLYLIIQPWQIIKFLPFLLIILYFFESAKGFLDFFQKRLKKPVLTKKTVFLILTALLLEILFIFANWFRLESSFALWLLIFDIFTPAIVSGIVLIFQPLAVLGKNQIIKKAKEKRAKFKDLLVIGITGSYGKTSTKEFLATILSEKFHPVKSREAGISPKAKLFNRVKILKTAEHQNSEVGVSQCILNDLRPEHEIFVVEMGIYNRGGIKLICDIAKPKIGVITGINEQHLATFGSLENIIKTKYELIESLPEDGLAIFSGDNKYCYELYKKTNKPKRIYSFQSTISNLPVDLYPSSIAVNRDFLSFKVIDKNGESAVFKVNLLGAHNVLNILAAVCCAKELGMSLEEIAKACVKVKPQQSGMQLKKGINSLNIIDATYSANPDGVISHLEYLKIWPGKKVIIMPCLIELGKASNEIHKRIGQKIGQVCDLAIITTKERFKDIEKGALESTFKEENILFIENPKKILEKIKSFCQPGDVIILESRVPNQLIQQLIISN